MLGNQTLDGAPMRYREAGEWLRSRRQYWQITQAELAEQAGIGDVPLIDGIEQGKAALPPVMQAAIARACGVDRDILAKTAKPGTVRKPPPPRKRYTRIPATVPW